MIRWNTIKRLWRIRARRPTIMLTRYGQDRLQPRVCVGISSNTGMMGLGLDWPDSDQGNAKAESYAKTLHHITALPVLDNRYAATGDRPAVRLIGTE